MLPLGMSAIAPPSGASGTVTVSGESITHSVSNGNTARAGVQFRAASNSDVRKREGFLYTVIDGTTDWIIPSTADDGNYEIRCVPLLGIALILGDSTTTWLSLDVNREWRLENSNNDSSQFRAVRCEIRYDGGSIIDDGQYNLEAIVGLPP